MRAILFLCWVMTVTLRAQSPWADLQRLVGVWIEAGKQSIEQWDLAHADTIALTHYRPSAQGMQRRETKYLFRRPEDGSITLRAGADFILVFFTRSSWTFEYTADQQTTRTVEYALTEEHTLHETHSEGGEELYTRWFRRGTAADLRPQLTLSGYEVLVCNRKSGAVERFDAYSGAHLGTLYTGAVHHACLGPDGSVYLLALGATPSVLRIPPFAGDSAVVFIRSDAWQAPTHIAFGPDGHLYLTDRGGAILRFDGATGRLLQRIVDGLPSPLALTWDVRGQLFATCSGDGGVYLVPSGGAPPQRITPSGSLQAPTSLCFSPTGELFVADADRAAVKRFRREGERWAYVDAAAVGFGRAEGLTLGPDGHLYVCDFSAHTVRKVALEAAEATEVGVYLSDEHLRGPAAVLFRKRER